MLSKNIFFSVLLITLFQVSVLAQKKDKVLFTINNDKVYSNEFARVYEKNLSLVNDPAQKEIDNYLELFINYKLKLKEAYQLKMDTVDSYKREYARYENQLIQPYLKDENLELDLIREAYDRSKKEINASHILLKLEKGEDTLSVYNKITELRNRIINGEDFEKIAKENSQDPSAAKNGGNLNYFTVFQMVYPFENVVYNTKVGEVSQPFKTQFGYHIVKVNDIRDSQGEVEVAHIMLREDNEKNRELIQNLKKQLDAGAKFDELANSYSQDGGTNKTGGVLPRFGTGRMIPSFEKVAFSLKNEGEISEPFKSEFGWHIIKLIKKYPIASFDEMKTVLKQKVDQGQRAQMMGNSVAKRLLKEYKIETNKDLLNQFANAEWTTNPALQKNETLLTVEGQKYAVSDFYSYLSKQNNVTYNQAFNNFREDKVMDIYKTRLPEKHPELKETMKEYREGLLLFDLMQKRIWDRAEKDSIGLREFFEKNKSNYRWQIRAKITQISMKEDKHLAILDLLNQDVDNDSIWNSLKDEYLVDIRDEMMETNSSKMPKDLNVSVGSYVVQPIGSQYKMYYVQELLPESDKKLSEVKGKVMSDYQDYLEKEWIKNLRQSFAVKINQKTLKALKAKYN